VSKSCFKVVKIVGVHAGILLGSSQAGGAAGTGFHHADNE
jgi:hypothetical protein